MLAQKVYRKLNGLRSEYLNRITYKAEIRNIECKEKLWSQVTLSPAQEAEIKAYWKNTSGIDIDTRWHRLYQSYMGVYDKRYFPEILYSTRLEPRLSPAKYHNILSDKGLITSIFGGDAGYRMPETIVYNCNGVWTNRKHKVISDAEVIREVGDCGSAIIKPTVETSSGIGVRALNMSGGVDAMTGEDAVAILAGYGANFIVQERIPQSSSMAVINNSCLNTFRIVTYIHPDGVYAAPLSMRIGSGGAHIDNLHAGGMGIGVRDDFTLRKYAFTEMGQKFDRHPDSGLVFDGHMIPALKKCLDAALRLHGSMPQVQIISWDWSIDVMEMPVLIEVNISGQSVWFPQMLNGLPMFGDHTEYYANLIREK